MVEKFRQDISSFEKILSEGELFFSSKINIGGRKYKRVSSQRFFIGKDEKSRKDLANAKDEKAEGLALGFPESAAEAWPKNLLDPGTLPAEDFKLYDKFRFFELSKSNWKKEMEVIRNWTLTIKDASPSLYEKILSEPVITI